MAKTVLAVDDDADFLELLKDVLSAEGYLVNTSRQPADVVRLARELQPAIVIVDLKMPNHSGWQIIEQLKADPRTSAAQIVVCTGATGEVLERGDILRQLGCLVLLKPFELADLFALLSGRTPQLEAS